MLLPILIFVTIMVLQIIATVKRIKLHSVVNAKLGQNHNTLLENNEKYKALYNQMRVLNSITMVLMLIFLAMAFLF